MEELGRENGKSDFDEEWSALFWGGRGDVSGELEAEDEKLGGRQGLRNWGSRF